jgi:multidrug efflux pump
MTNVPTTPVNLAEPPNISWGQRLRRLIEPAAAPDSETAATGVVNVQVWMDQAIWRPAGFWAFAAGLLAAGVLRDRELIALGEATVDRYQLAVAAVRWIFPMTATLVLSAWALGVRNSHGKFFLSYFSPVFWNAAIVAAVVLLFGRLPTSFIPNEDQGNILVNVQLPPGATQNRTLAVMQQVEQYMLAQPEVQNMVSVMGFSFAGSGQNAGLAFVTLKDWSERSGAAHSAQGLVGRAFGALGKIRDAIIFPVSPPAIRDLGRANGFAMRLQDRGSNGHDALLAARNQLLGLAGKSPLLVAVRPDGLEDAAQLQLDIDRDKAQAMGVSFSAINSALSTALGSAYVNDYPNAGRVQRVVVQADAPTRMQPDDLLRLNALNTAGNPVPLAAFASTRWITGAMQQVRYNGYPTMRIAGEPATGVSSGAAIAEMERLAAQLPPGFAYEWTGLAREEKLSGSTALILFAFSLLSVFLCLAALYESWSIPLSVILVVPLGVLGVILGASVRGLENDVFFKVGLITIIGLSAKNAVLIIEFAKDLAAQGRSLIDAVLEAAHLRFRPILMTSMAFILGVLPLVLARGAGSASQHSIGTGVLGGMLSATSLAVFFVPVFFVVVRSIFKGSERQRRFDAEHGHAIGADAAAAADKEDA